MDIVQVTPAQEFKQELTKRGNIAKLSLPAHINNHYKCDDKDMRYNPEIGLYLLYRHITVRTMSLYMLSNGSIIVRTSTFVTQL
jgi:hypothetical protein